MTKTHAGFRPPMRQKVRSSDDLYVMMGHDPDFEQALWTMLEAPYLNEERIKDLIVYQRELLTEAREALAFREDQLERIDWEGPEIWVQDILEEKVP